jgi:glycosyltransferase involved in cell wall biosynthesis
MATFNGERFIEEQMRSILLQLNSDDEVIVSDGGSSDRTLDIINSFNDCRIKILHWKASLKNNSRFCTMDKIRGNFENALKQAQGDIIILSDQDDIWLSNKVSETCNQLRDASCIIHDCSLVDDNSNVILPTLFAQRKPTATKIGMFIKSPFMGCCMAINRSVLQRALPFPNTHIEYDTWIGICAHKTGKVVISDKILLHYRRHGNNASFLSTGKSENPLWLKLMRRIYMLDSYVRC